jgi:phosphoglycerol transferase MdoB-like AlkP superfamily enzyme
VFGYPTLNSKFYLFPNAFPKRLQARGFATRGFHGNVGSFYNRSNAYLKMGFQDFYDIEKMGLSEEGWGAADSGVYEYVLKRMAEERQPFFYYVITMSSHEKFTNVNTYYNNPNYDDIPYKMTRNYLNSMTYTDRQLKIFVEQITSRYPDTYIFIFGDHTPYVINSGPYRRSALSHDQMELEFVPLFILTPQQTVYQEKSRVAGFLDITPTVITASGVETSLQLYGTDLFKFPITEDTIHYRSKKLNREMLFRQLTETASAVAPHLYP